MHIFFWLVRLALSEGSVLSRAYVCNWLLFGLAWLVLAQSGGRHKYLDKEFVSPTVERLKRLCNRHVKHKHAAVCSSVERHAEGLRPFLTRCIPNLKRKKTRGIQGLAMKSVH